MIAMSIGRYLLPLLVGLLCLPTATRGQDLDQLPIAKPKINIFQELTGGAGAAEGEPATLSAWFKVREGTRRGTLSLKVELQPGWHVYSIAQPKGGPAPSVIKVASSDEYKLLGDFQPDRPPRVKPPDVFPVPSEEHEGQVTWSAPISLEDGVTPEDLKIELSYTGQACFSEACIPISRRKVEVKFAGYEPAAAGTGAYHPESSKLALSGHFEPKTAVPGGKVRLVLTATPDPGWHVYAYEPEDNSAIAEPTLIVLTGMDDWKTSSVKASSDPKTKPAIRPDLPPERYHDEPVTWTIDISVPKDAQKGERIVTGMIGYQTCTDKKCLKPTAASFRATLPIGDAEAPGQIPLEFNEAKYADVAQWAKDVGDAPVAAVSPTRKIDWAMLWPMLGFAALGGMILNLMPCVLPVLGLKLLSFARQGGQSRGQVVLLNLAYTAGLLTVFLALATLVAFANLGWGEQFTRLWFRVSLTALVFVMALSFLGVWQLPIPGFATSEAASELQHKEGLQGAFFKGLFTTLIATPCSGPFLGAVFGLTLELPPLGTFLIFTAAGLGMAAPYLVVGMFPGMSRLIPKPGAWMETFERILGFVMLAAAVFQFASVGRDYATATLLFMVALAFACWLIGRVPEYADKWRIFNTWLIGGSFAAIVGVLSFNFLGPPNANEELPWQPFSPVTLAQLQSEGKTVLIDFTADWCPTCQYNGKFAINTYKVHEAVKQHDIVPLLADWTNESPEIKSHLASLKQAAIPVLAIYPAGRPEDVIVLDGILTEGKVLEALEQAGPSKREAGPAAVTVQSTKPKPAS